MKITNKGDFSIKISGNHYFACDYVFSNLYGDSGLYEEDTNSMPIDDTIPQLSSSQNEILTDTLPATHFDMITTMPECTKKIELVTEGSVCKTEENGIFIRYGDDLSPVCVHILDNGSVTISSNDCDLAEIIFENGKRNYIALMDSIFGENSSNTADEAGTSTSINLCVDTSSITSNMSENGGSLSVSYSIELNGMIAEVTDFTITASSLESIS